MSGDLGAVPRGSPMLPLAVALDALPRGAAGIYVDHARGRCTWVTRIGPIGRRSRELWVLVDVAAHEYRMRGMPRIARHLERLHREFHSEVEGVSR